MTSGVGLFFFFFFSSPPPPPAYLVASPWRVSFPAGEFRESCPGFQGWLECTLFSVPALDRRELVALAG